MVGWSLYNIGLGLFLTVVEAFQSGEEDTMETIEAAEALLNMDSPSSLSLTLDEKHLCESYCLWEVYL